MGLGDAIVAEMLGGRLLDPASTEPAERRLLNVVEEMALAAGVPVRRASRCLLGGVVGAPPDALPSAGILTPVQARIELMLDLLADAADLRRPSA